MSDLEDLEDIVEQNHFGVMSGALFTGAGPIGVRVRDTCGRGHDLMVSGRWYKAKGGSRRRRCFECARIYGGYQGIYRK